MTAQNTNKPAAAKRPAAQSKSTASTAKSSAAKPEAKSSVQASAQTAKVETAKSATETVTVDKKVSSPAPKAEQSASAHIADQIKGFSRRRVWPD
jgi:hypothetical protein